jgi:hypothetical protein
VLSFYWPLSLGKNQRVLTKAKDPPESLLMYDDVNYWLNSCTNMSRGPFNTQNDPLLFDSYSQPDQSSLFAPTPEYAPTPGYGVCQTPSVMSLISPEGRPDDDYSPQYRYPEIDQIQLLRLGEWEEVKLYDELPPTSIHHSIVWKMTLNNNKTTRKTQSKTWCWLRGFTGVFF